MQTKASIVIPAYNEGRVIERCLRSIFSSAEPGEFEVIVACNGCTDQTASIVRSLFPLVRVLESEVASKVVALNSADKEAQHFPRIYLDADLSVTAQSLRCLIEPLVRGEALVSCGRMDIDDTHSNIPVRAFYKVWKQNAYFDGGKFGGLFAVSRDGHSRISPFPKVTNDDEMVRRKFSPSDRAYVDHCSFTMVAPRTLEGLINIRTRAIRGSVELDQMGYMNSDGSFCCRVGKLLRRVMSRPSTWAALPIYFLISAYIRLIIAPDRSCGDGVWERDDSSREAI